MTQLILLEKKWHDYFKKIDQAKIEYVKRRCEVCKERDLMHYSECNHVAIDIGDMNDSVNRKLKQEAKQMLKSHLELVEL